MAYKSSTKKQTVDKFELVTQKIVKLLESGVQPWQKPWHSVGYQNIISGNTYRGINPLLCAVDCLANDYNSPYFVGFDQASKQGWKIKKGSKATWLRWGGIVCKDDDQGNKEFYNTAKWLQVFNLDCVDDSEADIKIQSLIQVVNPASNPDKRDVSAEEFIKAQSATIKYFGDVACYTPSSDAISMPVFEDFRSADTYYATHIHELTHWTGHKSRCDRDLSGKFGSQKYAFEELIAELGAAFVCNELGIESTVEHHASYLDSWMQALKSDSKAFFKAASAAQKAASFLMKNAGLITDDVEE